MRGKNDPKAIEIYNKFKSLYLASGLSHSEISQISGISVNTISVWLCRARNIPEYGYEYLKLVINNYNKRNVCNANVICSMSNENLIDFFSELAHIAFKAEGKESGIKPTEYRDLKQFLKGISLVNKDTLRNYDSSISLADNPLRKGATTSTLIKELLANKELTHQEVADITKIPIGSIKNWVVRDVCPPPYVVAYIRYKLKEFYNLRENNGDVIRKMSFDELLNLMQDIFDEYYNAEGNELKIKKYSDIEEFINSTSLIEIELFDFRRKFLLGDTL